MNRKTLFALCALASTMLVLAAMPAYAALGGASGIVIPYAGKLELDGALVTGSVDFEFGVAPDATQAPEVGCVFLLRNIPVTNGEFALSIAIPVPQERCVRGKDVHLKIAVRRASISDPFIPLGTQRVTPVVAAATSGTGDFAVTGQLVAGSIVSASGGIEALTANTAAVTGALSAGPTTITGDLAVSGRTSVGLTSKQCSNTTVCICDGAGFVAIAGGPICSSGGRKVTASAPFLGGWYAECDQQAANTIAILCARLGP